MARILLVALLLATAIAHNVPEEGELVQLRDYDLGEVQEPEEAEPTSLETLADFANEALTSVAQGLSEQEIAEVKGNATYGLEDEVQYIERNAVPDDITCHWDLVEQRLSLEASRIILQKKSDEASDEYEAAFERNLTANTQLSDLASHLNATDTELELAKDRYSKLHEEALKLYYAAKGDLDSYNNERKKVDLDAAQSKSTLTTYLNYKKKYIESSVDSEDPDSSEEVQHYKKLAKQYLDEYHEAQQAIQNSYANAKEHQSNYFDLSKKYHDMSEDANDVAKQVEKMEDDVHQSQAVKTGVTASNAEDIQALPGLREAKVSAKADLGAKLAEFTSTNALELHSKFKYFKFVSVSETLEKLAGEAHSLSERSNLRYLDFTSKKDETASSVEGALKSIMMLETKIQAANETAVVFQRSFDVANCQRILAEEAVTTGMGSVDTTDEPSMEAPVAELAELGEGQEPEAPMEASPEQEEEDMAPSPAEQCKSDKTIADANAEATSEAQKALEEEQVALESIQAQHTSAIEGAETSASIRDSAKVKGDRLDAAAAAVKEAAQTPC